MQEYDYIIIGGGPCGLSLAQLLSKKNKSILIIDSNDTLGGCHRVISDNSQNFIEHGPRVYSSAYVNFINLLKDMNLDFYKLFTKYNFTITQIGGKTFNNLFYNEKMKFVVEYIRFILNKDSGKNIYMKDFCKDFHKESQEYIDRVCRITDGTDSTKYTLNKFLCLLDDQIFYNLYQPSTSTDKGLFYYWGKYLQTKDVEFSLNCDIKYINSIDNTVSVSNKSQFSESLHIYHFQKEHLYTKYSYKKLILAIPPVNMHSLLKNSNLENIFDSEDISLKDFSNITNYNPYICITFQWKSPLQLEKIHGFPANDWGIVFNVITDYYSYNKYNTIITVAITILDKKSKYLNKSVNEINNQDLIIQETFRQLNEVFKNKLDMYSSALLNPNNVIENKNWMSKDTAFINTINKFLPFDNTIQTNIYNCGTHNGKSKYNFTSLESAVSNSIELANKLEDINFPNKTPVKLRKIIHIISVAVLIKMIFS